MQNNVQYVGYSWCYLLQNILCIAVITRFWCKTDSPCHIQSPKSDCLFQSDITNIWPPYCKPHESKFPAESTCDYLKPKNLTIRTILLSTMSLTTVCATQFRPAGNSNDRLHWSHMLIASELHNWSTRGLAGSAQSHTGNTVERRLSELIGTSDSSDNRYFG